ncbi:DUF3159 domain-containing protein [Gordonia sp. L191]|uniref:DUF3159 domain-containing protein n=1 Tax=Gordonia sp. L191 TaxID=2982699 RepID=UPI0024BFB541|nr:DUF3159 domain-containing protein [Gordonia sp. L191]WHU46947.1 DUF3159 domain-containing protein [Gordonia sp. L191]
MGAPQSRSTGHRRPSRVWTEIGFSAVPSTVFAVTASSAGLGAAIAAAAATTVAIGAFTVWRWRTVRPVIGACVGVSISAAFALHSGRARDFFLPDLWYPPIVAVALIISCLVGYPVIGLVFGAVTGRGTGWRRDPSARRLFGAVTLAAASACLTRFVVQYVIYQHGSVGWLAVGRIATGLPLTVTILMLIGWAFRHVERQKRPDVPSRDVRPVEARADEVSATDELSHTGRHQRSCR